MIFFHKLRKVRNYPLYLSNNSVHQNCYHNTLGKCHGADYRIVRRIFQIFDEYMLTNISSIWRIYVDEYFKYLTNICWRILQKYCMQICRKLRFYRNYKIFYQTSVFVYLFVNWSHYNSWRHRLRPSLQYTAIHCNFVIHCNLSIQHTNDEHLWTYS